MPSELPEMGGGSGDVQGPQGEHEEQDRDDAVQDDVGRDCEEVIDELEEQLELAQARIADLERQLSAESMRSDLEKQLVEAGAVDLETAMVLAERRLAEGELSVSEAVESLKSTKGFLFRSVKRVSGASAMAGSPTKPRDSLDDLAREARETGDRRAVLRYLRRRRG